MHPSGDSLGGALKRLDRHLVRSITGVQLDDLPDSVRTKRRQPTVTVPGGVRALDQGGHRRTHVRVGNEAQDQHRSLLDLGSALADRGGELLPQHVQIVEHQQGGMLRAGGASQVRLGQRQGRSARAAVLDMARLAGDGGRQLGRQPCASDAARPGNDQHPAVSTASLAPAAPEPRQLRVSADNRRLSLELQRQRLGFGSRRGCRPRTRTSARRHHLHRCLEAFQLDRPVRREVDSPHLAGATGQVGRDQNLARRCL